MNYTTLSALLLALALPASAQNEETTTAPAEPAVQVQEAAPAPKEAPAKPAPAAEPKSDFPEAEPKAEAKPEPKPQPKPVVKKAEPKPEPVAETAPELKPEPKPVVKKEQPKPAEAAPAPAPKELTACAQCFTPVAAVYKKAHDDFQQWIAGVDAKTAEASAKIEALQAKIEANEAAITKAKLKGGKDNEAKGRDLAKDNKQLWADLEATRKERSAMCQSYAREAILKAKQFQGEVLEKLESAKSQAK